MIRRIKSFEKRLEKLKRQRPMKPIREGYSNRCARCGNYIIGTHREAKRKKCEYCGQVIDWSEELKEENETDKIHIR